MGLHKDIRIVFQLGDRWFEAVGFLGKKEEAVLGREALRRTNNGRQVRSSEEYNYIFAHRVKLPAELRECLLATATPTNVSEGDIACFGWDRDQWWLPYWNGLNNQWFQTSLVLRRCDPPEALQAV